MDYLKSLFAWVFGVVFIICMFPVTILLYLFIALPFSEHRIIHKWLSFQAIILIRLNPLWTINIEGRENFDSSQNYVIISNHQSMLDIPLMQCLRFPFVWISKIENTRKPIIGLSMKMAGYLTVERGNKESVISLMNKAEKVIKGGNSVFFFPEGTRSKNNEIKSFKSGAFSLAMEMDKAILPILLDGTGAVLPKRGMVFSSGHKLIVKVLRPISPDEFGTDDPEELAEKFQGILTESLKIMRQ